MKVVVQNLAFQSTLPRGERRSVRFRSPFSIRISIHAPTGGATEKGLIDAIMFEISIHAPTGGATGCRRFRDSGSYYFNPRSHGGSDKTGKKPGTSTMISIHAPTGGATTYITEQKNLAKQISIHAPTGGATL